MGLLDTRIPLGSAGFGGLTLNDILRPFTDSRGSPDMLPADTSLGDIGGALSKLPRAFDPQAMAERQVNAQRTPVDPSEPYGAFKHLLDLFPMAGLGGGTAERGAVTMGAGRVSPPGKAGVGRGKAAKSRPKSAISQGEAVSPAGVTPGAGEVGIGDIADPAPGGRPPDPVNTGGLLDFQTPVTHQGRMLSEWSPQDFEAFGKEHGVENLGPLSPPATIQDLDGNAFSIPGGMDGKFTYYDLLHLKSQAINADRLAPELHTELQRKLARTMTPDNLTPEHIFSGILFGITSPNQPLLPNQMAASRLKAGSLEDIGVLADMVPWKAGDKVDPEIRKQYDSKIAATFGLQGSKKGGLGIKGSQDYTRIAELAQLFKENPDWFRLREGEAWPDLVDRVSSQVTGLGTKTGSFSSVWQNPAGAQVSAMDRHMAQRFFEQMFPTGTAERAAIEADLAGKWNAQVDRRQKLERRRETKRISKANYAAENDRLAVTADATKVEDLGGILGQSAGDGFFTDQMLSKMGAGEKKLNVREGTGPNSYLVRNPRLSQGLQETDWIKEPEYVKTASPLYRQALDINAADAASQGLSLFASQWRGWDRQRRRLEPHENMFPGLEKLPRPSNDQLRGVLKEHRKTGHLDYTKEDQLNDRGVMEARLRPTRPTKNPAGLAFFSQGGPPAGLLASQDEAPGLLPYGLTDAVKRRMLSGLLDY